jgi:DNA-binding transcriptional regulator YdaS (Cro superfamily)
MEISIKQIAEKAGGVVALSAALGLSRGAVSQWRRVPIGRVNEVEKITGIYRYRLRPDIFGEAPPETAMPTVFRQRRRGCDVPAKEAA